MRKQFNYLALFMYTLFISTTHIGCVNGGGENTVNSDVVDKYNIPTYFVVKEIKKDERSEVLCSYLSVVYTNEKEHKYNRVTHHLLLQDTIGKYAINDTIYITADKRVR